MNRLFIVFLLLLFTAPSIAAVTGKDVEYRAGDTVLKGYLATDTATTDKRPGILVIHEWWGHNAYARKRADMLAQLGYTALAVDMYGDGKQADHPKTAGAFSGELKKNISLAQSRIEAARQLLMQQPEVDDRHIAAIGYCFGGGMVLEMARSGMDLDGVASFHGSLGTDHPAAKGVVKARVLVANGAEDPFVKPAQIEAFKKEMEAAGVNYEFINYPDAKHSFTNPDADKFGQKFNIPLAYNEAADKASWNKLQTFFKEIFDAP